MSLFGRLSSFVSAKKPESLSLPKKSSTIMGRIESYARKVAGIVGLATAINVGSSTGALANNPENQELKFTEALDIHMMISPDANMPPRRNSLISPEDKQEVLQKEMFHDVSNETQNKNTLSEKSTNDTTHPKKARPQKGMSVHRFISENWGDSMSQNDWKGRIIEVESGEALQDATKLIAGKEYYFVGAKRTPTTKAFIQEKTNKYALNNDSNSLVGMKVREFVSDGEKDVANTSKPMVGGFNINPREMIEIAKEKFLGIKYKWGGKKLTDGGLDCSGFIGSLADYYAKTKGVQLHFPYGMNTTGLRKITAFKDIKTVDAGDLLFLPPKNGIPHVMLALGPIVDGKVDIMHAPGRDKFIREQSISIHTKGLTAGTPLFTEVTAANESEFTPKKYADISHILSDDIEKNTMEKVQRILEQDVVTLNGMRKTNVIHLRDKIDQRIHARLDASLQDIREGKEFDATTRNEAMEMWEQQLNLKMDTEITIIIGIDRELARIEKQIMLLGARRRERGATSVEEYKELRELLAYQDQLTQEREILLNGNAKSRKAA